MTDLFSPLVERAMRLAARAHRTQQRKATDLPYVSHPASVALILCRAGFEDEIILAAALLHDVLEDTDVTIEELKAGFPQSVTEIVAALSERKTDGAGHKRPWRDRKLEHLQEVENASPAVKAVALADKLHNLGSMLIDVGVEGESMWSRFNASKEDVFWYHESMIAAAGCDDDRIERLQQACREVLAQLDER